MPLYLSGFPERQHVARAPRLVRRQNTHVDLDPATPQRIGHHTDRDLTRLHVKHISSRNSIQSQQTALKAFRLARTSRRASRGGEIGVFPVRWIVGGRRVPGPRPSPLVLLRSWRAAVTRDTYSSAHAYGVDAAFTLLQVNDA